MPRLHGEPPRRCGLLLEATSTPCSYSSRGGRTSNRLTRLGFSSLLYAALKEHLPICEYLLNLGADLMVVTYHNFTALAHSTRRGPPPFSRDQGPPRRRPRGLVGRGPALHAGAAAPRRALGAARSADHGAGRARVPPAAAPRPGPGPSRGRAGPRRGRRGADVSHAGRASRRGPGALRGVLSLIVNGFGGD